MTLKDQWLQVIMVKETSVYVSSSSALTLKPSFISCWLFPVSDMWRSSLPNDFMAQLSLAGNNPLLSAFFHKLFGSEPSADLGQGFYIFFLPISQNTTLLTQRNVGQKLNDIAKLPFLENLFTQRYSAWSPFVGTNPEDFRVDSGHAWKTVLIFSELNSVSESDDVTETNACCDKKEN